MSLRPSLTTRPHGRERRPSLRCLFIRERESGRLEEDKENVKAHRLNRIALVSVFGLTLALPQAARGQTRVAAAEYIAGDSEVLRLADDTEVLRLAGDTEAYDALRRVSDMLYARGEALRALQLREQLGDFALSNRDAGVAADAYLDAAWIAHELALQVDSGPKPPFAFGVWSTHKKAYARGLEADAERFVRKAAGVVESGDLSDWQRAGIRRRLEKTLTGANLVWGIGDRQADQSFVWSSMARVSRTDSAGLRVRSGLLVRIPLEFGS